MHYKKINYINLFLFVKSQYIMLYELTLHLFPLVVQLKYYKVKGVMSNGADTQ